MRQRGRARLRQVGATEWELLEARELPESEMQAGLGISGERAAAEIRPRSALEANSRAPVPLGRCGRGLEERLQPRHRLLGS